MHEGETNGPKLPKEEPLKSPSDFIKDLYLDLLKENWTLTEIDEMDVWFFFELTRYAEERKKQPETTIDQIPGF